MNMDQLNRWLALAGNVGVIAGILFLAFEIQQSNRIAIASTEIDVRNMLSSINESVYTETGIAELLIKTTGPKAQLSAIESLKIYWFILRCLNTWLSVETAYANGMVPPETYNVIEDDMRSFFTIHPATLPLWRQAHDNYPAMGPSGGFQKVGSGA